MIVTPITMEPEQRVYEAVEVMRKYGISGVPVTKKGKLVGILTNRDLRFEKKMDAAISTVMTKENLITVPEGIPLEESKEILHKHRIEKFLVVDKDNNLKGLITIKDIEKTESSPLSGKDHRGRLRAGAAVGVGKDVEERVPVLLAAGAGFLVVGSAHGHFRGADAAGDWGEEGVLG